MSILIGRIKGMSMHDSRPVGMGSDEERDAKKPKHDPHPSDVHDCLLEPLIAILGSYYENRIPPHQDVAYTDWWRRL